MNIEGYMLSRSHPLSRWLLDFDTRGSLRFGDFYRKLIRFGITPQVTVHGRGEAEVAWGDGEPLESVMLTGLSDAQMIRLCFDRAMLMCEGGDDRVDEKEIARLEATETYRAMK